MPELSPKELKIIDAAQALFLRYGFKRVTMSDIANAVDMPRPALYLNFSNKEEFRGDRPPSRPRHAGRASAEPSGTTPALLI